MVRALRTLPVTLAVNVAGVGVLTLASLLGPLLGPAFGLLIQMGALVGGVYLLSFAPVIAAGDGRRLSDAIGPLGPGGTAAGRRQPHVRGDLRRRVVSRCWWRPASREPS